MSARKLLKRIAPAAIRSYLDRIQARLDTLEDAVNDLQVTRTNLLVTIANLETALDAVIENPKYIASDEAGFNGQSARKEIFRKLLSTIDFQFIVETGTWLGDTTAYMAELSKLPVFSAEVNRRYHSIAKMRLKDIQNVNLRNVDSTVLIKELSKQDGLSNACPFFYLDAHWYRELPLTQEIELIVQQWDRFVIMVDDFKVPGDDGYGYDDYGPGKTLSIEHIGPLLRHYDLTTYFPATRSADETGKKRGCVLLARTGPLTQMLRTISSLRRYDFENHAWIDEHGAPFSNS